MIKFLNKAILIKFLSNNVQKVIEYIAKYVFESVIL